MNESKIGNLIKTNRTNNDIISAFLLCLNTGHFFNLIAKAKILKIQKTKKKARQ